MDHILFEEWINNCNIFIQDYQSQHKWDEEQCLYIMWSGVLSSKYLNSTLIEKFIEILPKLSVESKTDICFRMCMNPALTIEMVLAYPDLLWDFNEMSEHMNINDILDHSEFKWNLDGDWVSRNPSVTMDVVLSNINKPWSWSWLSRNPNITMSDIESHMDLPWDWYYVSCNPNFTMTMIEAHPDKQWDWASISQSMKITVDLLRHYADKPWDFDNMSNYNPSITLELLLATSDLSWNYDMLSDNKCLTIDMLLGSPDEGWNWKWISCNDNITMSVIESHMDLQWDWDYVSRNPNVRICDIEKHYDKSSDWDYIQPSIFNPDEYIDQWLCKYSVISMHDEDYDRGEECLDYDNVVDLVIQNEYCISYISKYL